MSAEIILQELGCSNTLLVDGFEFLRSQVLTVDWCGQDSVSLAATLNTVLPVLDKEAGLRAKLLEIITFVMFSCEKTNKYVNDS